MLELGASLLTDVFSMLYDSICDSFDTGGTL